MNTIKVTKIITPVASAVTIQIDNQHITIPIQSAYNLPQQLQETLQ